MSKKDISRPEMAESFLFADAHEQYSMQQMQSVFNELMYNEDDDTNPTLEQDHWDQLEGENGFAAPDLIVLHGGPDEGEERQRFAAFENFMQFVENEPDVLVTESYMEMIVESPYVSEFDMNPVPMRPESTVDEVDAAIDHSRPGDRIVAISNDYHVPRMDDLYDQALRGGSEPGHISRSYLPWPNPTALFDTETRTDRNDYLLVGTQRFDEEFEEKDKPWWAPSLIYNATNGVYRESDYDDKWKSEYVRKGLPQGAKDVGKAAARKVKELFD